MTRLRTNTVAIAGIFVSQVVFVFLQMKILTRWMPRAEFGLFSAVFAFGALLAGAAELGFPVVLLRYGAKYEAEGRPAAVGRLLGVAIRLWIGAVAALALVVAGAAGLRLLPGIDREGITLALLLLGFLTVASFSLRSIVSAAFQGKRRMMPSLGMDVVFGAGVTLLYLLLHLHLTARSVFATLLGMGALVGLGGLAVYHRSFKERAGGAEPSPLGEIRAFWGGAFVTGLVAIALENADRLVIATLAPFTVVAIYHVAGRICLFARKILYIPQQVAHPELTLKWERGQVEAVRRDLVLFSKLEWTLGLAIAVTVVLGARVGVRLASTGEYREAAPALMMLAGSLPLLSLQAPLTTFLRSSGHIWVSVGAELVWLVAYLSIGAGLFVRFGPAGFAAGQIFAAVLTLLYTVASLRRLGLPRSSTGFLALHSFLGLAVWGAAWALVQRLPFDSPLLAGGSIVLFALLLNVALARGRFFSSAEEARLLGFLGGGRWSRAGEWLLTWPRGGRERE